MDVKAGFGRFRALGATVEYSGLTLGGCEGMIMQKR